MPPTHSVQLAAHVGQREMKYLLKDLLTRATRRLALLTLRLRRKTFDAISLHQFQKTGSCSAILRREAEGLEVAAPQFIGDYGKLALSPEAKITVHAPRLEIVEFADAAVMGGTELVFVGHQAIHADVVDPKRDMFRAEVEGGAKFDPRTQKLSVPGPAMRSTSPRKPIHVGEAVSLLGECSGNYAHWLIEILPKLAALDDYESYRSLPLLVDGGIHPIFYQTLALLNTHCRPIQRVNLWQTVTVKRLIYMTPPAYTAPENRVFFLTGKLPAPSSASFLFSKGELAVLRRKAVAAAQRYIAAGAVLRTLPTITRIDYGGTTAAIVRDARADLGYSEVKRVYLRRAAVSAGNPRQMIGAERVESILADFDFLAVDPAALSFAEQVMLLQDADYVVAPIGAALANLIFAPPGRKVIALAPYYRDADYYYFSNMMGVLGHELYYILGPQLDQPNVHLLHRDYMVDLQALKDALQRLCG